MNKVVSLPRINTHQSEKSKNLKSKGRKNSIDTHYISVIDSIRDKKIQNEEQKNKMNTKKVIPPMKRVKSEFLKRSSQQTEDINNQRRYGLNQNGKLNKITQVGSVVSTALISERSKSSSTKPQNQTKQKLALLKKQLNEVASSILILKKQMKAIEGGTLQLKQQSKSFSTEGINESNLKIQLKIQEIKKRIQTSKYDQDILKNMKDRLKQTLIHFEKKTLDLKSSLERQQKKIKILNQRSSFRQESINKKKQFIKIIQQKQKTANKLIQLEVQDYQRKMKDLNTHKQNNLKNIKLINADQYHYQVYKKQQTQLFEKLKSNYFLKNLLENKWNKYSHLYADVEKAQKLMIMHSIQKNQEEFNPLKAYFGSFDNKKQLQKKIKENQARLAQCTKKNAQLIKAWHNIEFNQSEQQQKILNSKAIDIKSGRIQQKDVIMNQQRQHAAQLRRKREIQKQKTSRLTQISDWIARLQKVININVPQNSKIDERLDEIIKRTIKYYRKRKDALNKTKI